MINELATHLARYGNEHEGLARPYMQVVWRDFEFCKGVIGLVNILRLDLELAPQGVDVFLVVVHPRKLHEVESHGRVCTVGPEHQVKADLNLLCPPCGAGLALDLEPGFAAPEVGAGELVVEEELDVGHFLKDVEQTFVETGSVYCKDGLGIVRTQLRMSGRLLVLLYRVCHSLGELRIAPHLAAGRGSSSHAWGWWHQRLVPATPADRSASWR